MIIGCGPSQLQQQDTKSNPNPIPNPNTTTRLHAIVNIQLNIITCPTYRTTQAVAPSVQI